MGVRDSTAIMVLEIFNYSRRTSVYNTGELVPILHVLGVDMMEGVLQVV